jgi:hypothetical protein
MDPQKCAPAALGVLFVDGFREQRSGSAVALLASALYGWLYQWTAGVGQEDLKLSDAVLSDTLQPEGGQPPHVTLTIPRLALAEDVSASWLLAESSWASLFRAPQFLGLARWIWKVSTCLLVLQFVIPMRRHWNQACVREAPLGRRVADALMALAYLGLMGVAAVLSVLVSLVLLVLAIASYLPIPRIDDAVRWVVVQVSAVLGDSYMLAHCPVQFAAMRTQIGRDLDWLHARCDKVAVVAHSQGAAIVDQVLKEHECRSDRLTGLVTLGQGISKLALMQRLDWDPNVRTAARQSRFFVTAGMASAGLPALGAVATRWFGITQLRGLSDSWLTVVLILAGFTSLGVGIWRAMHAGCRALENDLSLTKAGYLWSDYYASADPVSNGPLPRRDEVAPGKLLPKPCKEVFNSGSVLFDHNGYLHNRDELLPRLINDLIRAASAEPTSSDEYQLVSKDLIEGARGRRLRLVRFLIGARIAALAVCVLAWYADTDSVMRRPLDWLTRLLPTHDQMDSGTIRLVGALIITAAFYALAVTVWRISIGRSAERFFRTATAGARPRPRDLESASAPTTAHSVPGAAH